MSKAVWRCPGCGHHAFLLVIGGYAKHCCERCGAEDNARSGESGYRLVVVLTDLGKITGKD